MKKIITSEINRICYVACIKLPSPRAHALQITQMCNAFSSQGKAIELILPKTDSTEKEIREYYDLSATVKITRLSPSMIEKRSGLFFHMYAMLFFLRVRLYLSRGRSDVVYARQPYASLCIRNVVLEIHRIPESFKFLLRLSLRRARCIVSTNEWKKRKLVKEFLIPERRITVAPNGVNIDAFKIFLEKESARKIVDLPIDKKIVMYVGSLTKWKGVSTLIGASSQLDDGVNVVIVGGSQDEISKLREEYDCKNCIFLGQKESTEVPLFLKAADLLVIPTVPISRRATHETSPIKVFEYMASGVPIVASDLSSIREILSDETAHFFTAGDKTSLAEVIHQSFTDIVSVHKRAQSALEVIKKYSWHNRAVKILEHIQHFS